MNTSRERLYQLLPAIYRERDLGRDELRSLLKIIEDELQVLEDDIGNLYENWFIETCDDWVVPYIGDLLGVRGVGMRDGSAKGAPPSVSYGRQESRAYIANTLAYRRRKGTAPVMEQLVRDVTGWSARAVEFFDQLAITQNLDHVRKNNTTIDLRYPSRLQLLGTPFEQNVAYSVEVGLVSDRQGQYNLTNIGLFVWRLQSYPIQKSTAFLVPKSQLKQLPDAWLERCYTFNPLGKSVPLFNRSRMETDLTELAQEINIPGELRCDSTYSGYGEEQPVFQIFINGYPDPIPAKEVLITHLSSFNQDAPEQWAIPADSEWAQQRKIVAVDPELGRFVFLEPTLLSQVEVNYAYGFSADMGGGPYDRGESVAQLDLLTAEQYSQKVSGHGSSDSVTPDLPPYFSPLYWEVEQARSASANPLAAAIQTWNGTIQTWRDCHELTAIVLARLEIPRVPFTPSFEQWRVFQPGIVEGLTAIVTPGSSQVVITPGRAFDCQGRALMLEQNSLIQLDPIKLKLAGNPVVWVLLSYQPEAVDSQAQVQVIPQARIADYPEATYIRITGLLLDAQGHVRQELNAQTSKFRSEPFQPGIVEGLSIITQPEVLEAVITPGIAVNDRGRTLTLTCNQAIDLRDHQGHTIWIVLSDPDAATHNQESWMILTEQDGQNLEEKYPLNRYLRLGRLYIPVVKITQLHTERDRLVTHRTQPQIPPRPQQFQPGVVRGLTVLGEKDDRRVTLTAGLAIDSTGEVITLNRNHRLCRLGRYRDKTMILAIAHRQEPLEPAWKIDLFPVDAPPPSSYLPLASLKIDARGRLESQPTQLASQFQPGIIEGLTVSFISDARIQIQAGKAANHGGQILRLEQNYEVNFSRYPGRYLLLAISPQPGQGWKPLLRSDVKPIANQQTNDCDKSWQYLSTVPVEPIQQNPASTSATTSPESDQIPEYQGTILVKDNHTYSGDLEIVVLANSYFRASLQVVAADGYRPHIRGDVSVRGEAEDATNFEPSDVTLDGFLLEGNLTVRPGNLHRLDLAHCTLVPQPQWGLTVESVSPSRLPDLPESASPAEGNEDGNLLGWLIALVIYSVTLIWQLLQLAFGRNGLSAQEGLVQLRQMSQKILANIWYAFKDAVNRCLSSPTATNPDTAGQGDTALCSWLCPEPSQTLIGENHQLTIRLDRSICGAIHLAETIPNLIIQDSLIDAGIDARSDNPTLQARGAAITAPGSKVTIHTTTALGTTKVRLLETSDSIFAKRVIVIERWKGCMRFCYLPLDSQTPSRYRCQPDVALQGLPKLPSTVTALAIASLSQQIFAATAENGIFYSANGGVNWTSSNSVSSIASLVNKHITSLLAYSQSGTGRITSQGTTTVFAGTKNGTIWRSIRSGEAWTELETQSAIAANLLPAYAKPGTGTIASLDKTIQGNGTAFTVDLNVGDLITARNDTRIVAKIVSDQVLMVDRPFKSDSPLRPELPPGTTYTFNNFGSTQTEITAIAAQIQSLTGTLQSQETTITGMGTAFERELTVGDAITVEVAEQLTPETRIVTQIASDTSLTINAAFSSPLSGTPFKVDNLYVGTAGGGVFRLTEQGNHWTPMNQGLSDRYINALAMDGQGRVFAAGQGGVFCWSPTRNRWRSLNRGLVDLPVSALVTDTVTGRIFVGTEDGQVLCMTENRCRWIPRNTGLPGSKITHLAIYALTRKVSVHGLKLTSLDAGTPLQQDFPKGRTITLAGQTKTIQAADDTTLTIDSQCCPEVSGEVTLTCSYLFAGTAGYGIWRSLDEGQTWHPVGSNLANEVITALAIAPDGTTIFAGTAIGSVFYSGDRGDSWISRYQGLTGVEQAIPILARIQPRFTSLEYAQPGYGQLGQICPSEIRQGTEDGSEMGAFNHLKQSQREANLQAVLNEYLRFGLKAGIFYMT